MHELDKPYFDDRGKGLSEASYGKEISASIKFTMRRHGIQFPNNSRYIAMAAGWAKVEKQIATDLKIPLSHVTFLDRNPEVRSFAIEHHGLTPQQYICEGIFSFLSNPPSTLYSLATLISTEYMFQHANGNLLQRECITYAEQLQKILTPHGIVYISPPQNYGEFQRIFESKGFTRLNNRHIDSWVVNQIYIKSKSSGNSDI